MLGGPYTIPPPPLIDFGGTHVARCWLYETDKSVDVRQLREEAAVKEVAAAEAFIAEGKGKADGS